MAEQPSDSLDPAIRRGRVGTLNVHEITEAELQTLEQGSPTSLFLNLSIAAGSTAVSLTASLASAKVESDRVFVVLVVVTVVAYVCAITFGLLSRQQGDSVKKTLKSIRSRVPPEGKQVES